MSEDALQPLESAVDRAGSAFRALRDELRALEEQNDLLRQENERLRSRIDGGDGGRQRLETLEAEREVVRERVERALRALEEDADGDG